MKAQSSVEPKTTKTGRALVRRVASTISLCFVCVVFSWNVNRRLEDVARQALNLTTTTQHFVRDTNNKKRNGRLTIPDIRKLSSSGLHYGNEKGDLSATTTTTTTVASSRSNTTRSSPVCQPTWGSNPVDIRRIFFAHTRKAGGSYIRRMLKLVEKRYNVTVRVKEGDVDAPEIQEPPRSDTLYITNLRHPIERIVSDYKYEGRWDCRQLILNKTLFKPTADNSNTLQQYINITHRHNAKKCPMKNKREDKKLWYCTQHCYLGWFGQFIPECEPQHSLPQRFVSVRERLSHYHLIVILEWLKDPNYRRGLFDMFGLVNESTELKHSMYCDKISKFWNDKHPATIPNETVRQLYQQNQWDVQLYETLVDDCTPEKVAFPTPPPTFSL